MDKERVQVMVFLIFCVILYGNGYEDHHDWGIEEYCLAYFFWIFVVFWIIVEIIIYITSPCPYLPKCKLSGELKLRCWFIVHGIPGYKEPLIIRASLPPKYDELVAVIFNEFNGTLTKLVIQELVSYIILEKIWQRFPQINKIRNNQRWEFDYKKDFIVYLGELAKDPEEFQKKYLIYLQRRIDMPYPAN